MAAGWPVVILTIQVNFGALYILICDFIEEDYVSKLNVLVRRSLYVNNVCALRVGVRFLRTMTGRSSIIISNDCLFV